ncbi:MAG: hypothetical protein KY475_18080 [Planctomycetes bacterium]|nr:hypothetical protein [Planctomycetota bacterium]
MKRSVLLAVLCLWMTAAFAAAETPPLEIGSRLELFVDHYLIERLDGQARLELQNPQLVPGPDDAPPQEIWASVIKDGSLYRMYVRGRKDPRVSWRTHSLEEHYLNHVLLYFESDDGVHWTAPDLGLYDVPRYPAGNVIMADEFGVEQTFAAFLDNRPGIEPSERFKGIGGKHYPDRVRKELEAKYGPHGLRAYASADGIHWRPLQKAPVIPGDWGNLDSQNVAFWSEAEEQYVCYFRVSRG